MRLLIVDDEVYAISGIMNGVNWEALDFEEILQANSYAQAVEILEKKPVDVALCDIEMPDESGLELIGWINEHTPGTECIILSCHDEFDFARQAIQLKCLDYILKPVRYDFLTNVLKNAGDAVREKKRQAMLKDYGKIYLGGITKAKSEDTVDVVEQVIQYIDLHLSEKLNVKELANMVYISPDHLTRSFKKRLHMTVSDYILQKRMVLASELLKERKMTITMVSDSVGFGNYSYFTEQFKHYYKMTPREYQNVHREEK